jgi:hypothetical protein
MGIFIPFSSISFLKSVLSLGVSYYFDSVKLILGLGKELSYNNYFSLFIDLAAED